MTDGSERHEAAWTPVPAYLPFLLLLALYYLGARVVGLRPAVGTSASAVLGLRVIPDLMLAYVVLRAAWIGILRSRTLPAFASALRADLVNRATLDRLLGIALFVLGTVLAFDVYGAFKQAIPSLSGYVWDGPFAGIDWLLHLGRDPWTLTAGLPTDGWAFALIDRTYQAWFMTLVLTVLVFATWAPWRLRARFFLSLVLILILGGTVGAVLFASGGPAYFGDFTGDVDRFAPLLQHIDGTAARNGQRILWEAFSTGSDKLYGGISAMPSMHVAMAALMAVAFYWWNRVVGWSMAVYLLLIQVGSVHLGWHYAIDGYVAMILSLWLWSVAGRILGRLCGPEVEGVPMEPEPEDPGDEVGEDG